MHLAKTSMQQQNRGELRAAHCVGLQLAGKRGARCYVAVAGGINTPAYLGSRSTFPGGKLGGVQVCYCLPSTGSSVPEPLIVSLTQTGCSCTRAADCSSIGCVPKGC